MQLPTMWQRRESNSLEDGGKFGEATTAMDAMNS